MRFVSFLGRVAIGFLLTLVIIDGCIRFAFPKLTRFNDNFSAAYLRETLEDQANQKDIGFLGDSVLWGYKISPFDAAVSHLASAGYPVKNFSFEGGSTVNTYAMLRYMEIRHSLPRAVVFNVNLKEFNAADSAYSTLYPGLEQIAWASLTKTERSMLKSTVPTTTDARIDRSLSKFWALYGFRSDIHAFFFGDADFANALRAREFAVSGEGAREAKDHQATADRFMGTYDLAPISDSNVEMIFLRKTVALLERNHIRSVGILTPTNHSLLHEYIDVPEYQAQLNAVSRVLRTANVKVLDYDHAFSAAEFIDNDHLTVAGNRRLAGLLRRDIAL